MPAVHNGIPYALPNDKVRSWAETSENLAEWIDANTLRRGDVLNDAPPAEPHTHSIAEVQELSSRLAGLQDALDALDALKPGPWVTLVLKNGWTAYTGGGGYFNGLRARATATGIQLDGMIKGSTNGEIAIIPESVGTPASVMWSGLGGAGNSALEVSSGNGGKNVKSRSGSPAQTAFLSISNVIPYA